MASEGKVDRYVPNPHMPAANTIHNMLRVAKNIFLYELVYLPLFKNSQKKPATPYVNQLAKTAAIRPRRSLKFGILNKRLDLEI